jgi:hypothetical protein
MKNRTNTGSSLAKNVRGRHAPAFPPIGFFLYFTKGVLARTDKNPQGELP